MTEIKNEPAKEKRSSFNLILEVFGWLRIVASPLLIGVTIGFAIYLSRSDTTGLIIAISVATVGLIIGIIWATRVWKKKGTLNYLSKVLKSDDLDYLDEDNKNSGTT